MDLSLKVCWVNVFVVEAGRSVELFQPDVSQEGRMVSELCSDKKSVSILSFD